MQRDELRRYLRQTHDIRANDVRPLRR